MRVLSMLFALVMQVTPPPPPPMLVTPAPSPPAAVTPAPSPSAAGVTPVPSPLPSASPAPLNVSPSAVSLHPLQSQTIAIENGAGPFVASIDTPIATVAIDQTARTLTVTASAQTGTATITLDDTTGASVQIPLRVALDAGSAPPSLELRVTGTQLDTQWLTLLVQKTLLRAVQLQPGAAVQVQPFTLPPALGPGASASVPVPVQITGEQYFPVNAMVSVNLQNVDAPPFSPPLLMYDDDPEKLTATGVLFRGEVGTDAPARLYYYHENGSGQRELGVVVSSTAPSTVQLIDASAGPSIDVMSVGHAVSRGFLEQKPFDEGIVVDVAPQTPYVADDFVMNSLDGAAGSIGIRVMSGAPVTVTVLAVPPGGLNAAQLPGYLAGPQLPGDGHHRTGLFSLVNYASDTLAYTAPGPDADIQYGARTPPAAPDAADPVKQGRDFGEYGVLRAITFDVNNPLDQPQTLYLYERPLGGDVRSSFLVNGALVQVGCARLSDRYQIGAPIVAPAHGTFQLPVLTMTDGGSNYPLEVGLTASPPQPGVPPITAPDGCFPKPQPAAAPAASPAPAASATPFPAPEPTGK